jgi:methyl-accepting chemotaxis protein
MPLPFLRRKPPVQREPPAPGGVSSYSERSEENAPESARLGCIAQAAVELAALGPRLAAVAAEMENQARTQASRTVRIAATMGGLARDLDKAVSELRASSGQMHRALETVGQIADHTRLLSINASIEAARAGAQGRSFAVIVDEVKQLADRTGQTTLAIGERIQDFEGSIARMNAFTATGPAKEGANEALTVGAVNLQVRGMADSAGSQLSNAENVHSLGDQIKALTETLLIAVGKFRFDAHARAREAVEALATALAENLDDRSGLEGLLERWLGDRPHFELAYLTDASGRQIVDNIVWRDGRVEHDPRGFGRDWSERPWFQEALAHRGVCSTDVYRSSATGDFCFTVAAGLRDRRGALLGVFGSDVNFQRLVGG